MNRKSSLVMLLALVIVVVTVFTSGCSFILEQLEDQFGNYSITFETQTDQTFEDVIVTIDGVYELPQPTREGYTFDGWYLDGVKVENSGTWTIKKDTTLTAKWIANEYTISFDTETGESIEDRKVAFGSEYTLPQPSIVAEGYTFEGWYNGDTKVETTGVWSIADDVTLTAKWIIDSYTITYNGVEGAIHTNPTSYTNESEDIILVAPTKEGFTFVGWTYDGETTPQMSVTIPQGSSGNKTYTANWTAKEYTIYFDTQTSESIQNIKITFGTQYTLPTPSTSADGYTFAGWYNGAVKVESEGIWSIADDVTLEAKWTLASYTITYEGVDGLIHSNPTSYTMESEAITLVAPQKLGYTFVGWTFEGQTEPLKTVTIATGSKGNKTFTANWTLNTYSITYNGTEGATHSNPTSYTIKSESITLVDPIRDGYTFNGWTFDGQTEPIKSVTIAEGSTGNKTYTANWTIIEYTITYEGLEGATHSNPASYTVESDDITLVVPIRDGYTFAGWTFEGQGIPQVQVTIAKGSTGNKIYTANWVEVTEGLQFSLNSDDSAYIVTGYEGASEDVYIPSTYNGKLVTSISEYAFMNCSILTSITISSSVTSIGLGAFSGCSNLESITLPFVGAGLKETYRTHFGYIFGASYSSENGDYVPSSLKTVVITGGTSIGSSAFENCSSLVSITIPSSVTSIGEDAFSNCSSLRNVYYNGTIEDWCNIGFDSWDSNPMAYTENFYMWNGADYDLITEIEIPETVTSIGNYQFRGFENLTSITISSSVTSIGLGAFSGCRSLTSITIPSSVTSIGSYAFHYCSSLTAVTFGENSQLESIGSYAFKDCSSLTSITIPSSVTSIGNYAFYGCSNINAVYISDIASWCAIDFENAAANPLSNGCNLYINGILVEELVVPDSVETIKFGAFYGCGSLTAVTFGENSQLESIDSYAFYGCSSLTDITISSSATSIGNYTFSGCSSLTTVTFGENSQLESIGSYAFKDCSSLTSITIPSSITSIGSYAFYCCYKLVEVINKSALEIVAGSTSNGYVAYYAKQVIASEEESCIVTSGDYTFYNDNGNYYLVSYNGTETDITLPSDINGGTYAINEYAFYRNYNITSVVMPEGVTSIGYRVFYGCGSLVSITIPSSVTSIGSFAFYGCSSLTSITIPSSITSIGEYAFSDCSSLVSITIPSSVTSIGDDAFSGCSSLVSITIPSSVTSIDGSAFNGCSSLVSITIPSSVISIGYDAFYGCSSLQDVYYNGTVEDWCNIGFDSWSSNPMAYAENFYMWNGSEYELVTEIEIPNTVTSIGDYQFRGFENLTSITIPSSITSIGDDAFFGCSSLSKVYYGGTSEQWEEMGIDFPNGNLTGTTIYYYSAVQPTTTGNYWRYVDGVPTKWN